MTIEHRTSDLICAGPTFLLHPSVAHRAACPLCNPTKTVPELNREYAVLSSNQRFDRKVLACDKVQFTLMEDGSLEVYIYGDPGPFEIAKLDSSEREELIRWLRPDETTGWQPIETAPKSRSDAGKDREYVLVVYPGWKAGKPDPFVITAFQDSLGWDTGVWRLHEEPTHWMPLPEPPGSSVEPTPRRLPCGHQNAEQCDVNCAQAKAECARCAEGMNSFADPATGNRMHARNGVVTVCTAQNGEAPR